jgi:UDP-N-acetylglucosamine 2-epimerase (non-hydrolysing)
MLKLALVVGARPNFMKIAPIHWELNRYPEYFRSILVHTGQHYDSKMSDIFFEDLGLPTPDIFLGIGSGSHAVQTGQTMIAFERVLLEHRPDWVIVVGDVNSTVACALDAAKLGIKVAHVEAGLRSRDRSMPEEINRIMTDSISDLLFTPSRDGDVNLLAEGITPERIYFVGNVMIDSLRRFESFSAETSALDAIGVRVGEYGLVTLHRPSNVDHPQQLASILNALERIQKRARLIFPIHPRTRKMMTDFNLMDRVDRMTGLMLVDPVGYKDFLQLERNSLMVLTDSGGIQEETTVFGIPCLTLRENTERPVTIEIGTNVLVGLDEERIVAEALHIVAGRSKKGGIPEGWDGRAAERIVQVFRNLSQSPHCQQLTAGIA